MNFWEKLKKFLGNRKLEDLTDAEKAELEAKMAEEDSDGNKDPGADGTNSDEGETNDDKAGKDGKEGKEATGEATKPDAGSGDDLGDDSEGKEDVLPGAEGTGNQGLETKPAVEDKTEPAVAVVEEGFLNTDGTINTDKVHDASAVKALNDLAIKVRSLMIDKELNAAIKEYNLAVGVETIKKLLDTTKITVDGDKVIGIKEALDALKVTEPTLFKAMTSTPINEPFNPVKKELATNGMITSDEAWASKEGATRNVN